MDIVKVTLEKAKMKCAKCFLKSLSANLSDNSKAVQKASELAEKKQQLRRRFFWL